MSTRALFPFLPRLAPVLLWLVCAAAPASAAPALLEAARADDTAAVMALLEDGAGVNQTMSDGTTALHWAAYNGNLELVRALLARGAEPDVSNDYAASPMSEAAAQANEAILAALLEAGGDVESPTREGQTALMSVARSNNLAAARLLIEHGADVNARETWRGQTALMWASALGQPDMVELLVAHGADVDARSKVRHWERKVTAEPRPQNRPPGGFTALLLAAREGCAPCARALVDGGADIDLADPEGITPLLMATLNARWDVAAYLVEAGADVDKWDRWGRSPLYSAVDYITPPRGGRPDRPSLDQHTPLDVTALLLEAGANPDMQLKLFPPYRSLGNDRGGDSMLTTGTTPLIRAAKGGEVEAVQLLLDHGARPGLPNWPGYTPIMAAAGLGTTILDIRARFRDEARCIEAVRLLLAAGGDINAANEDGQRALHGAALWGWNDMIRFLVDNGAQLNAEDNYGMTALDTAMGRAGGTGRFRRNAEVQEHSVELLLELGAREGPGEDGPE